MQQKEDLLKTADVQHGTESSRGRIANVPPQRVLDCSKESFCERNWEGDVDLCAELVCASDGSIATSKP